MSSGFLQSTVVPILYLLSAVLFIFDLRWMSHPRTAVRGNMAGALGMALAITATLLSGRFEWSYILIGADHRADRAAADHPPQTAQARSRRGAVPTGRADRLLPGPGNAGAGALGAA